MHMSQAASNAGLASLIASIGEPDFRTKFLSHLYDVCGAEHSAAFVLGSGGVNLLAVHSRDGTNTANRIAQLYLQQKSWRTDPALLSAQDQLTSKSIDLVRADLSQRSYTKLRNSVYESADICDRIVICSRTRNEILGCGILRSSGAGTFSSVEVQRVKNYSVTLLAILNKHLSVQRSRANACNALTSLSEIEICLSQDREALPRRETEVCARTIYGMSSIGIALDLNIAEETVITYRKRAYQRLGITTQRELFLWYLNIWSNWQANRPFE